MGGIGKPSKTWTEKLYNYMLPKAEKIVVRDKESLQIAKKLNPENTVLYQDFAQETIKNAECKMQNAENKKYILININKQSVDKKNIHKIIEFCKKYPDHKKIFFPCDMNDDKFCFSHIKKYVPGLEMYDWTKKTLEESLSLFYYADGGI
jgi:polysaccharide pyruvyl transferase WcaK-like protein